MRNWLVITLLLVVTGCRKSEEKTTVRNPDGTIELDGETLTIQTADGTATIEQRGDTTRVQTKDGTMIVGERELPADFPIPLFAGAGVENTAHFTQPDGLAVFQLTISSTAAVKDIAEFYEKFFKDKGVSVTRTEQTSDDTKMVMLYGSSDQFDVNAMVLNERSSEPTTATISWSVKKR